MVGPARHIRAHDRMRGADVYYGEVAENYDAARSVKTKWRKEQAAVAELLTDGDVLDIPFGTGRFVPIYRAKEIGFLGIDISGDMLAKALEKYPGVNVRLGDIFALGAIANSAFATAVCVRFLEWLPLDQAKIVIDHLRPIARTLIVSITHGTEGEPEAFTYDYGKFLYAIDGLLIEGRRVTAHVRDMISEIFKLRPATFDDVFEQFRHDHPDDPGGNVQRIADKFAGFFCISRIPVRSDTMKVRAEYWSGDKLGAAVATLAEHRFLMEQFPRRSDRPLTVIERDGLALIIDGRKRANRWMREPGPHPVLVIRPA